MVGWEGISLNTTPPGGRLRKLAIKPGYRVALLGVDDPGFKEELAAAGAEVVPETRIPEADLVFLCVEEAGDLGRLAELRRSVKPAVAVWTLRRKGRKDLTEAQVMQAGLAAGFVDVKVVSFSETLTAEKFVIRLKDRGKG